GRPRARGRGGGRVGAGGGGGGVGGGRGGGRVGGRLAREGGAPQGRCCKPGNRRALRSTRNRPSPPSPPPHAQTPPPAVRPSRPCPSRALTVKVSHNWAGEPLRPRENDGFEKRRRLVLSRHTLWKSLKKSRLEHELAARGESRQHGRGGIENRPSADVAANRTVDHGLPRGPAPQDSDEPPAVLELAGERLRGDLGRAVEEDDVVRNTALPA